MAEKKHEAEKTAGSEKKESDKPLSHMKKKRKPAEVLYPSNHKKEY